MFAFVRYRGMNSSISNTRNQCKRCYGVRTLIDIRLSQRRQRFQIHRFFSYYHDDSRYTDRIEMLRRQQMNLQKTTVSEQLLGLQDDANPSGTYQKQPLQYTMKELRTAYFQAAKKCHPDSMSSTNAGSHASTATTPLFSDAVSAEDRFIMVTNAYEYLRQQLISAGSTAQADTDDDDSAIDLDEENKYRQACFEYLGQPAEIVEESKRCPLFRQWLFGRTDAAYYWQSFFMVHGGLAPRLRTCQQQSLLLAPDSSSTMNDNGKTTSTGQRRKRPQST